MRKNGVNRELRVIEGGVCAPDGFRAGACACGIRKDGSNDLALIMADKRCSAAAVFSDLTEGGATAAVAKKYLKSGYARGFLVNGGAANLFLADGEKLAVAACTAVEKYCSVLKEEIIVASTGEIGKALSFAPFEKGIKELSNGLLQSGENSLACAEVISSDGKGKQLSYSFDIGDYSCKIGAIFNAPSRATNSQARLVFLTTDVNIEPAFLQKALSAEVRETLGLLNVDGLSSPNDGVFILASGKAGNYRICAADTEYRKFADALRLVLLEISKEIAENEDGRVLFCNAVGVKSKQTARAFAKALAGNSALKKSMAKGRVDLESVLFLAAETGALAFFAEVKISVGEKKGSLLLMEEGRKLPRNEALERSLLSGEEVTLTVDFSSGNYKALAIGSLH